LSEKPHLSALESALSASSSTNTKQHQALIAQASKRIVVIGFHPARSSSCNPQHGVKLSD